MSVCGICLDVLRDTKPLVTMQTDIASNSPDKLHPDPGHWKEPVTRYDIEKKQRRTRPPFHVVVLNRCARNPWIRLLVSRTWCGTFEMSPCGTPVILYIQGILPKGPYLPCLSMYCRTLLAGYHRHVLMGIPIIREPNSEFTYYRLVIDWYDFKVWQIAQWQLHAECDQNKCGTLLGAIGE